MVPNICVPQIQVPCLESLPASHEDRLLSWRTKFSLKKINLKLRYNISSFQGCKETRQASRKMEQKRLFLRHDMGLGYKCECISTGKTKSQKVYDTLAKAQSSSWKGPKETSTCKSSLKTVYLKRNKEVMVNNNENKFCPSTSFPSSEITRLLNEILQQNLEREEYEQERCLALSKDLSHFIHRKIQSLTLPRYKFVSYVHIGKVNCKGTVVSSRCLWDTSKYGFAAGRYRNDSLYAIASVCGFYSGKSQG